MSDLRQRELERRVLAGEASRQEREAYAAVLGRAQDLPEPVVRAYPERDKFLALARSNDDVVSVGALAGCVQLAALKAGEWQIAVDFAMCPGVSSTYEAAVALSDSLGHVGVWVDRHVTCCPPPPGGGCYWCLHRGQVANSVLPGSWPLFFSPGLQLEKRLLDGDAYAKVRAIVIVLQAYEALGIEGATDPPYPDGWEDLPPATTYAQFPESARINQE